MPIKSLFSSIICVGLLFVIIYPLKFVFFPYATTRVVLGVLGLFFLVKRENIARIRNHPGNIILVFIFIMLMSVFTDVANCTNELFFIKYPFAVIAMFSACCFWHFVISRLLGQITQFDVSKYIVGTVDIQMIIVIVFFLFPQIKDSMLALLTEELHPLSELGGELAFRISGFGSGYAGSGQIHSFVLVICIYNICHKQCMDKNFFVISMILIFIIGTFMSRTTLVGLLVALFYYFYKKKNKIAFVVKTTLKTFLLALGIYFISNSTQINISDDIDKQLRFGFEMFYNFFENGTFETTSTNELKDSYNILPNSLKTWVIGDGKYFISEEVNYMGTDNGYLRMIFYFGIIGMIIMFWFNYLLYKNTARVLGDKSLPLMLFILYFIINFKGDVLHIAVFYGFYLFIPSCKSCINNSLDFKKS